MPHRLARALGRFASFGAIPAISVVTPLLAIPVMVRYFGEEAWADVAVAQSVGAMGGIVVALAWPQIGPMIVATNGPEGRAASYRASLEARRAMLVLVTPLCVVLAVVLTDSHFFAVALMAAAIASNGLTATWYFVGTGQAQGLLITETLPRVVATLVACAAMVLGAPLLIYPLLFIGCQVLSSFLNSKRVLGRYRARCRPSFRVLWTQGREQLETTISRFIMGIYTAGAVTIVAAVAPSAVVAFAAIDRLQKAAANAVVSFPQAITSWAGQQLGDSERRQRMLSAAGIDLSLALIFTAGFYLVLPVAYRLMLGSDRLLTVPIAVGASLALGFEVANRALRMHCLFLLGEERFAAWLHISFSIIGAVGIGIGAVALGAFGAVAAGAGAQVAVFVGTVLRVLMRLNLDRRAARLK